MGRRNTGCIRERTKGSFEIRYELPMDSITGKRKTKTFTIKGARKDAEKALRKQLASIDVGTHIEPNRILVRDFLEQWLELSRMQISKNTHHRYADIVRGYLIPAFGNHKLTALTKLHIQAVYNQWQIDGRRDGKGGLSPQSCLHNHRVFKLALKNAVDMQLLTRNPIDSIKAPKVQRKNMATLNNDEVQVLLEGVKHTRVYIPTFLALATGMRRGEILALKWKNVDFENKAIRVVDNLVQIKQEILLKLPKGNKPRAIKLPDYAVSVLNEYRIKQSEELLRLGIPANGETLVCGRFDGKYLQPTSLTHEFTRMVREILVPRVRFHDLRHTHATLLLRGGIHPKVAQERLGHSTIAITMDLYSHVTETMQDDAAAKLDKLLGNNYKK